VLVFSLILSSCSVHGRERPVWSCGVVDWFGRPLNEQPVAWSDSWSQRMCAFVCVLMCVFICVCARDSVALFC